MTENSRRPTLPMTDDRAPTDTEVEVFERDALLEDPGSISAEHYLRLWNVSAAFWYTRVLRAQVPDPPEYVTVRLPHASRDELTVAIAKWNMLWEAAQFRRRLFSADELPPELSKVADHGDVNVVFLPGTPTRYHEYAPLFHLLPRSTVERYGLPLLRAGQWPFLATVGQIDRFLPADFEDRLGRAWASTVWRHLMPGSPLRGFSGSDPIRLLAHNLDFWLPPVTEVVQEILRDLPVVDNGVTEQPPRLEDGTVLEGTVVANPRKGSDLWQGEVEAAEAVRWTVEEADADGRLRGILDAVRSNRVEDDFSEHWSYAREDFERKLYRKRSKVRVRFVELTDTIPVQGPETEVEDDLVFADFLALLDERERVVLPIPATPSSNSPSSPRAGLRNPLIRSSSASRPTTSTGATAVISPAAPSGARPRELPSASTSPLPIIRRPASQRQHLTGQPADGGRRWINRAQRTTRRRPLLLAGCLRSGQRRNRAS